MNEQLYKSLSLKILESFTSKKFPDFSYEKYKNILEWIENENIHNESQLLSFVARAYFTVGKAMNNDFFIDKSKSYSKNIKDMLLESGHFNGPKHIHRTYFALKAIHDIEGISTKDYSKTLTWLKSIVNEDGGWSKQRFSPEKHTSSYIRSDTETTATAIQILSFFIPRRDSEDELNILLNNAIECLISLGDGSAWGEECGLPPSTHATSHSIRALIVAEPFVRFDVKKSIIKALEWFRKLQCNGGFGGNEAMREYPNIGDTTLAFIALNYIQEYDAKLLPSYDPMIINCINYLWFNLDEDHWNSNEVYAFKADSLQFTSILVRELINYEWEIKNKTYYQLMKTILDDLTNEPNLTIIPKITNPTIYYFRGAFLLIVTILIISMITSKIINTWIEIENFFSSYQLLGGVIASIAVTGISTLIVRTRKNIYHTIRNYIFG